MAAGSLLSEPLLGLLIEGASIGGAGGPFFEVDGSRARTACRHRLPSVTLNGMVADVFTPAERAVFRRLGTPEKIQYFLDFDLAYNKEPDGNTCRSPRRVLRDRTAHCMEGALFGAAALRMLGHPPLLLDLEAVRDDECRPPLAQRRERLLDAAL